jgi:flavorubredoxin
MSAFHAVQVSEHVYWVGAIDWNLRDFHGYTTQRGSTYNAYLILGEKPTLVDTVKASFFDEMLARIASVMDPADIDYIISNHTEMDHSGSLPQAIAAIQPERVFASTIGARSLPQHFDLPCEITPVASGGQLSLGNMDVTFLETRMLHWPDSMFTYVGDDKLLLSSDAFGMHLASEERFADQISDDILYFEGAKYFANILLLYAPLVTKLIAQVQEMGLPLEIIAPDHGPIWRSDPMKVVTRYADWAAQKPTRKAVIVYDTMWGSTEKMARALEDGLAAGGAEVKLMSLKSNSRADVVTEVLEAGALLVGSPTLNNGLFPTMADIMTYLKGLKPRNLVAAAFGSYGWSGEAPKLLTAILNEMKLDVVGDGLRAQYVPKDDALEAARNLGLEVAKALTQRAEAAGS